MGCFWGRIVLFQLNWMRLVFGDDLLWKKLCTPHSNLIIYSSYTSINSVPICDLVTTTLANKNRDNRHLFTHGSLLLLIKKNICFEDCMSVIKLQHTRTHSIYILTSALIFPRAISWNSYATVYQLSLKKRLLFFFDIQEISLLIFLK